MKVDLSGIKTEMSRDIDFINTSFGSFTLEKEMIKVCKFGVVPKSFTYCSDK